MGKHREGVPLKTTKQPESQEPVPTITTVDNVSQPGSRVSDIMSANIYGSTNIMIEEDMLKPDRRRNISYRKMYILSLFLDLI